jgi:DinB superfamily
MESIVSRARRRRQPQRRAVGKDDRVEVDVLSVLRWQFRVAWRLAEDVQLPRLTDDMCTWLPDPQSWTVHRDTTGWWRADWSETEPLDAPAPSVGWLTWHIIWWWSNVETVLDGATAAEPATQGWPGTAAATVAVLRDLADLWTDRLGSLTPHDLDTPVRHPWPEPRPLAYLLSWVNLELTKNVAEIGAVGNAYLHR